MPRRIYILFSIFRFKEERINVPHYYDTLYSYFVFLKPSNILLDNIFISSFCVEVDLSYKWLS